MVKLRNQIFKTDFPFSLLTLFFLARHQTPTPVFFQLQPITKPPPAATTLHRTGQGWTGQLPPSQPSHSRLQPPRGSPENCRKRVDFRSNFSPLVLSPPATKSDELGTRAPGDPQEGPSKGPTSSEYLHLFNVLRPQAVVVHQCATTGPSPPSATSPDNFIEL